MFKKGLLFLLIVTLMFSVIGCGKNDGPAPSSGGQGSSEQKVTLAITSAWAEGNTLLFNMDDFAQKVSEKTNGTVEVVWGGGPETIPTYQLVEALRNGIIDIAWTSHTYNVSHVPVMEAMKLTDAEKLRETGGFDFVSKLYKEKLNAHYIAATTNGLTYNLYTKNKIEN